MILEETLRIYLNSLGKSITGEYIFRLVWSDNVTENRLGTYNDFDENGQFIRTVREVRRVPKYNYIKARWIFEKWAPGSLTRNPETPDADNGDYIPVYVFESAEGKYLPPTRKVLEFIIAYLEGRIKKDAVPSQEYLEEREIQETIDSFDDHPGYIKTSGDARNSTAYTKELSKVADFKGD